MTTALATFKKNLTPWQRIGRDISGCSGMAEAIETAGLGWNVRRERLSMGDGRQVRAFALVRDDDNTILTHHVGPVFRPLQNVAAFRWFQPFIERGEAKLLNAGTTYGGERVWVFAGLTAEPEVITEHDAVQQFLLLSNCHSSRSCVSVGFVSVHLRRNLSLGVYSGGATNRLLRVRHTTSVEQAMEVSQGMIDAVRGQFRVQCDRYRGLAGKTVEQGLIRQYLKDVFRLSDKYGNVTKRGESIINSVTGRIEDEQPTWWSAYTAVCDHLTHKKRSDDDKHTDSLFFGSYNQSAHDALELAEEMSKDAPVALPAPAEVEEMQVPV